MTSWHLPGFADDAVPVATELPANVYGQVPVKRCILAMALNEGRIRIDVLNFNRPNLNTGLSTTLATRTERKNS
ncbi:hypothetical protein [Streptosporangium sp. CA-115845]|uniref:hypothetical protein n=1 Tax=Streptosporangium sp. CA-115845 TaxID=3240071 RepID=UPI003D8CBDEF